jgi:hypothetical protein
MIALTKGTSGHGQYMSLIALSMMLARREDRLLSREELREQLMDVLRVSQDMGRLEMQVYLTGLDLVDGWQEAPKSIPQ